MAFSKVGGVGEHPLHRPFGKCEKNEARKKEKKGGKELT